MLGGSGLAGRYIRGDLATDSDADHIPFWWGGAVNDGHF